MLKSILDRLEEKIKAIEKSIAEDVEFVDDHKFEGLYEELVDNLNEASAEVESFPFTTKYDHHIDEFNHEVKRLTKLVERIKKIEKDAGIESEENA